MKYRPKYKDAQGNLQDLPLDAETVKGVDVVNTKVDKSGDTMTGDLTLDNSDLITNYVRSEDDEENTYLHMYKSNNNKYVLLTTIDSADWGFYTDFNPSDATGDASMSVDGGTVVYLNKRKIGTGASSYYQHQYLVDVFGDDVIDIYKYSNGSTSSMYLGNANIDKIGIATSNHNEILIADSTDRICFTINGDDIGYFDETGLNMNGCDISDIYEIHFSNGEHIGSDLELIYNGSDAYFYSVGVAQNNFQFTNATYDNVQYPELQFTRGNTTTTYDFTANGIYFNDTLLPTADTNYYHTPLYSTGLKIGTGSGVNDLYVPTGNTASSVCAGNDSRLSDARTPTSHTHGNITNAGNITTSATIASGDALIIQDSSASKLVKSTITFDGSTETSYLSKKGTWVDIDAKKYVHRTQMSWDKTSGGRTDTVFINIIWYNTTTFNPSYTFSTPEQFFNYIDTHRHTITWVTCNGNWLIGAWGAATITRCGGVSTTNNKPYLNFVVTYFNKDDAVLATMWQSFNCDDEDITHKTNYSFSDVIVNHW